MIWVALILIGILAGICSGLFGIGGGLVIVPALAVFLGFTTIEAISTSSGALLMPVGMFAVLTYHRKNLVDVHTSAWIGLGLLTTTALGAFGALQLNALNPALLKQVYGVFLLVMGWRFAEPRKLYAQRHQPADPTITPPAEIIPQKDAKWFVVLLIGLVAGIFSGMFGIGGGAVIVPMLVGFLNYDQKRAVGTSLGALMLPVGLPGVYIYAVDGVLDYRVAGMVAIGLVFGSIIGARVALGLSSAQVKRLYGFFLFAVAINFLFFP